MNISDQLKKLRSKKEYSVTKCAVSIGVSPSTYRDWENGRAIRGEPYTKIASLFSISLSELFGLNECELSLELENIDLALEKASEHIKKIRSKL
jgi:transcriptional regulator with XRE-family HTH domain